MEEFEFEHDGVKHTARRTVTGARRLRQVIHFMGHDEVDGADYSPDQRGAMDATAQLIAVQILTGRVLPKPRR